MSQGVMREPPSPKEDRQGAAPGGQPKRPRRQLIVAEVVLLYGSVLAIAALPALSLGVGSLRLDAPALLTIALIYLPFVPYAQRRISLEGMGLGARDFGRSLKLAGLAALVLFPPFLLLWYGMGGAGLGIPSPRPLGAPFPYGAQEWAQMVAAQLLGVAIPEEWFFRGYLQERLAGLFPKKLGRGVFSLSVGAVLAAALFALGHAARYRSPIALNTFLPALLFGWSRERGGHLVAPVLLHAGANLLMRAFAG